MPRALEQRRRPRSRPCAWHPSGRWTSTKFATLGVTVRPSFSISASEPRRASARCAPPPPPRARVSSIAATPAAMRRRRDVERPADAVEHVGDVRRAIGPAEPQPRQPVDLRERARHHRVLGGRHQLEAGLVVVAAHVFGIGRVEHQQRHRGGSACVQAAHLAGTAGRCRSGCSGWRGRRSWCARVTRRRISSTSARQVRSGATTGVAPLPSMAIL